MAYKPNPRESAVKEGRSQRTSGKWGVLDEASTSLFLTAIGKPPAESAWKDVPLHEDMALTFLLPKPAVTSEDGTQRTMTVTLPKGKKVHVYFSQNKPVRGFFNDFEYEGWNGQVTFTVVETPIDGRRIKQVSMLHTAR